MLKLSPTPFILDSYVLSVMPSFLLIIASVSTLCSSRSGPPGETVLQFEKQPYGAAQKIDVRKSLLCISFRRASPLNNSHPKKVFLRARKEQHLFMLSLDSEDLIITIIILFDGLIYTLSQLYPNRFPRQITCLRKVFRFVEQFELASGISIVRDMPASCALSSIRG